MTNLEIDRALALAIGWKRVTAHQDGVYVRQFTDEMPKLFSHLDPAVIWPIAERFDCFPFKDIDGVWHSIYNPDGIHDAGLFAASVSRCHPNPATAVALAVIEAHK